MLDEHLFDVKFGSCSEVENDHRARWGPAALRRAAWIEDPDTAAPLDLRLVRVPVDDRVAARERRGQPLLPPRARAGNVHEPDSRAFDLHDPPLGERRLQG